MPDDTTAAVADQTTQTGTDTTTTQTQTTEAVKLGSFVNEDGSFKEGWREAVLPQELRGRKVFETFTDLPGAVKLIANQEAYIGKLNNKGIKPIFPLTDKSTPEERAEYYKALGRPDSPEGYKLEAPRDLADRYDPQLMTAAAKKFHDLGLDRKQGAGVMEFYEGVVRAGVSQMAQAEEQARTEAEAAMKQEWGANYDANLHEANRVIAALVPEKDREPLLEAMGNSKEFARFLVAIAPTFGEGSVPPAEALAAVQQGTLDEIKTLQATPGFIDGTLKNKNRAEHDRIVSRLAELYKKAYPSQAQPA
jgi:hypothetical protein